jgi:transcriptional regulator of arginine metabolism
MHNKNSRHTCIRDLLIERTIGTHQQLSKALREKNIFVSQATLSNDLRELGVLRVPKMDGGFRYTIYNEKEISSPALALRLKREFADNLFHVEQASSIVVLKTRSGYAQSICESIDRINWESVVGTLAGENTVFVATTSETDAKGLLIDLLRLCEEDRKN